MQTHALAVQRHDVEANRCGGSDDLRVIGRDSPKARAFARIHAPKRAPECPRVPALHFNEHERTAVEADRVDLAAGQANVSREDAIAARRQKSAGTILSLPALPVAIQ